MKKILIYLILSLLLISCSVMDRKVDELNYRNDIQQMQAKGKLTEKEAIDLIVYIGFLKDTTFPSKIGINKTYRRLLKESKDFFGVIIHAEGL